MNFKYSSEKDFQPERSSRNNDNHLTESYCYAECQQLGRALTLTGGNKGSIRTYTCPCGKQGFIALAPVILGFPLRPMCEAGHHLKNAELRILGEETFPIGKEHSHG